jgi:hypothetical protein
LLTVAIETPHAAAIVLIETIFHPAWFRSKSAPKKFIVNYFYIINVFDMLNIQRFLCNVNSFYKSAPNFGAIAKYLNVY